MAIHVTGREAVDAAVAAGVDSIEHGWAVSDAVRIARTTDEPRAATWYDEALATAQRCGMRILADQLLQLS